MRSNKKIDGLRISAFVDEECKKIIQTRTKEMDVSTTFFLETLIKESLYKQTDLERVFKLTELNQDLYIATNATYSNINQIAFALNVALKFNAKEVLTSKDIMINLDKELREINTHTRRLRMLFLEFLSVLNSGNPEKATKFKKALYRLKKKDEIKKTL